MATKNNEKKTTSKNSAKSPKKTPVKKVKVPKKTSKVKKPIKKTSPATKKATLKKATNVKKEKTTSKKPVKKTTKKVIKKSTKVIEQKNAPLKKAEFDKLRQLKYKVGDYLSYPHHGVGKITKIHKMTMRRRTTSFLELKFVNSDLEMDVAEENLEKSKVRMLLSKKGMKEVLEIIGSKPNKLELPWSKRYKDSVSKLSTANPYEIAEIIRDLHYRSTINDISSDERNLLIKARKNFAAEICVVMKVDPKKAHDIINKALNFVVPDDQKENLMYCHVEHNSSSFDKAGGTGIHRIAKAKKQYLHGDDDGEDDPYKMLGQEQSPGDEELLEEEELLKEDAVLDEEELLEEESTLEDDDSYDDITDD